MRHSLRQILSTIFFSVFLYVFFLITLTVPVFSDEPASSLVTSIGSNSINQFKIGAIKIKSTIPFSPSQMGLEIFSGQNANADNIKLISNRIRSYLLNHGFPFGKVEIDFSLDEKKSLIDLVYTIEAGEGFKYGGFKYTGSRVKADVLERLSLLQYGETFSESRLLLARQRLARTGYFDMIFPTTLYRDSTRNLLYQGLVLNDFKGNRFSGILGYDSQSEGNTGLNGFLDIHLINLRGTARDLDFNFESKQSRIKTAAKDARIEYTEPWILNQNVGAKVNLQVTLEDSLYDERNAGIEFFHVIDFHSSSLINFARQSNHDYIGQIKSTADIAGLGFLFDARDKIPFTLNGWYFSVRVNGVHRDLSDSSYFLAQSKNEISYWKNLGRWVAYLQFAGNGNWPLSTNTNRGDLFSVGGANSLRGFREKEFLTNLYGYANLEMQFLLAPKNRASVFITPALINRMNGIEGDVDWQREMGYGIGMESGAKDWSFKLSYALNPDRSIANGFLHVSVINNF